MARSILVGTGTAWLLAGVGGLALAAIGAEALERMLPPLAIDTDALRAAILSFSIGLMLVGVVHLAVVAGLRSRHRRAWTVGILMAAVLAMTSLALSVASATSAVADPDRAVPYVAGAVGAAAAALVYGLVVARLVRELRSGTAR